MNQPFYKSNLDLNSIKLDLINRPREITEKQHLELVERLACFYRKMKSDQKKQGKNWQPAGEWKDYNEEKNFLYDALLEGKNEIASNYLYNFWRNRLGLIVKEYATFEALTRNEKSVIQPFLSSILRNYLIWKDIYKIPVTRLQVNTPVGNPWGCEIEGVLVTPKATRYHHNALQIKNLLKACNGSIIGEIGAGYGGLCHYLLKEVPEFTYFDFDLPETLVLAAYYLISCFPNKKIFLYGEYELDKNTPKDIGVYLLPNFAIQNFNDNSIDVFFNSFSLSEMPSEINESYIKEIARLTRSFFLHNNMDRKGVINRGFERIPASDYPMDDNKFTLLSKNYDLFHSHFGDYKEFLFHINN